MPHYSHTVVVPVASPETAPHMLRLAATIVDRDEGRILALTVASNEDNSEEVSQNLDDLEDIVQSFVDEGIQVEIVTQVASNVTRGILDGAREHGAETLILGVHQPARRAVQLGSIVENILEAAPCDVLVYRPGATSEYDRVFVPLDGSMNSMTALNNGILIAKSREIDIYPMYIQRDYDFYGDREKQVGKALQMLDDRLIHKEVIPGHNPAERILRELHDDDLLVIGFYQKSAVDLKIDNDITRTLLNRASGPVLLASRLTDRSRDSVLGFLTRRLQRFNPALTQAERNELVWAAQKTSRATLDYLLLILLSAVIASFGLLLNSVAVIIGAMLVAPLMSPLGALSTGLATGKSDVVGRSVFTLIIGFVLSVVSSLLIGWLVFIEAPTSEMLGRGMPSLLDAGVALSGGVVAAFALARKEISTALAGVAIAAALMPPVCTIGLGLALGDMTLAGGATLLFVTNIVFIIVAEYIVLIWLGMRPRRGREGTFGVRLWWGLIGTLLVVVLSLLFNLTQQASQISSIQKFVMERLPAAQFVDMQTGNRTGERLNILMTIRTPGQVTARQVAGIESELTDRFDRPIELDIAAIPITGTRTERETQILIELNDMFPQAENIQLTLTDGSDTLDVEASLRTPQTITPEIVSDLETRLTESLEQPVRLTLIPQRVYRAEPTPSAEATDDVTGDETTNDEQPEATPDTE
jgi:uncharacterized hydrophobic protein (TIGR00271 family)